jgi:hypothetical protein
MVLTLSVASCVSAFEQEKNRNYVPLVTHELVIGAHDWEAFPIQCYAGDTLSGEFQITHNGELFPGDQTEYDNFQLGGIDFFVFDEVNYSFWVSGSSATSLLERPDLEELTWSTEIPYDDVWYIVYSNDSIFMKEIEGQIVRSGAIDQFIPLIAFIGLAALLSLIFVSWKKK